MELDPVREILAGVNEPDERVIAALRELRAQHHMHGMASNATTLEAFMKIEEDIPNDTRAKQLEAVIMRCSQEMTLSVRDACGEPPAWSSARARGLADLHAQIISLGPAQGAASRKSLAPTSAQQLRTTVAPSWPQLRVPADGATSTGASGAVPMRSRMADTCNTGAEYDD